MTSDRGEERGVSRRKILECMTWAGTGVLWTVAGGMPRSLGIMGEAAAAGASGLTFLQISDSHVGFDKPANPNAIGTLEEAVSKIKALPVQPSFIIHTGDITHLSKPSEFDDADRIISQARLDVHYVPGEHDVLDEDVKLYRDRYGRGTNGAGWYSFDANGVHFIGLVNVVDLTAGGLGNLGNEQLEWLEDDLKGRAASTPIVVFAHIPLWSVYPAWGWGTEDAARALEYLKRFGSVTVLNGHIHQIMQKVEGNVTFHTAMSTAFPQPAPGAAPSPGPMKVADDKLRSILGITDVNADSNGLPSSTSRCSAEAGHLGHAHNQRDPHRDHACGHAPRRSVRYWRSSRAGCGRSSRDRPVRVHSPAHHGEGRDHRDLDQRGRRPSHRCLEQQALQVEGARYRRQVLLHVHDAWHVRVFLLGASAHDGRRRGRSGERSRRRAMMLDRARQQHPQPGQERIADNGSDPQQDRARRSTYRHPSRGRLRRRRSTA
jgi:3',5'-cyclic AMP phosphodiesterase CpdA